MPLPPPLQSAFRAAAKVWRKKKLQSDPAIHGVPSRESYLTFFLHHKVESKSWFNIFLHQINLVKSSFFFKPLRLSKILYSIKTNAEISRYLLSIIKQKGLPGRWRCVWCGYGFSTFFGNSRASLFRRIFPLQWSMGHSPCCNPRILNFCIQCWHIIFCQCEFPPGSVTSLQTAYAAYPGGTLFSLWCFLYDAVW